MLTSIIRNKNVSTWDTELDSYLHINMSFMRSFGRLDSVHFMSYSAQHMSPENEIQMSPVFIRVTYKDAKQNRNVNGDLVPP